MAYERDINVIAMLEREKSALEENWTVYLATIASAVEGSKTANSATMISVTPVWQVRGLLPKGQQQIAFPGIPHCPARGSLPLNHIERDRLLVIFERPGSKSGMSAEAARSGELINAITMYALKVDPGQFR
ncbi:hypothetical protein G7078_04115 [Sphingomonas sinipercae]|uniref:Uncharacterized protein n=1 Tax=Sphingomonas sinipercae TaxID=2714944 RepID=A0A6G7ZM99_9SPHN|nr:hypothetical protein [Sphingomonas sinipercae]QIL02052.1 hypothetical protein G7078_04115 [Sphingomonas sinipercae]